MSDESKAAEPANGSERIEWIEKAAVENFKAHVSSAEGIEKQCATTLTVLFAGIAGGLAYAVKGVDSGNWTWLAVGSAAFTVYLICIAGFLVLGCMWVGTFPQIHNEPKNLLDAGSAYSLEEMRRFELQNMQDRIQQAVDRNNVVADRLNWVRLAMVASPGVFIVAAACWVAWAA